MRVNEFKNGIIYIENAFPLSKDFINALEDNDQNNSIIEIIPPWSPWIDTGYANNNKTATKTHKGDLKRINWDYSINQNNNFWPRIEVGSDHSAAHKQAYDIISMIDQPFLNALDVWYEKTGNKKLDWVTKNYTIKKYHPGREIAKHADRSKDKKHTFDWTALVYLNDDYEGGELYFNDLDLTLCPTAGSIVFFSTDEVHTARKVVSGNKYFLFFYIHSEFGICHSMKEDVGNILNKYFLKSDNSL